jgi:type I restriction enzyme S subunit
VPNLLQSPKVLDEVFKKTTKVKENAEKNLQNTRELFESYLQSVFANQGDGWEEKKIGDVCKVIAGQSPASLSQNDLKWTRNLLLRRQGGSR